MCVAETTFSTTTGRIDVVKFVGGGNDASTVVCANDPRRSTLSTAFLNIWGSGRCLLGVVNSTYAENLFVVSCFLFKKSFVPFLSEECRSVFFK